MISVPFGTESGNDGPVLSFDASLLWRKTNGRITLLPLLLPLGEPGRLYFFVVVRLPGPAKLPPKWEELK